MGVLESGFLARGGMVFVALATCLFVINGD